VLERDRSGWVYESVRLNVEPEIEEVILCLPTSVWRGSPGAGNGTSQLADRRSAPTGPIL